MFINIGDVFSVKQENAIAKKIDTAVHNKVSLSNGRDVIVQELSFMGTIKALRIIAQLIKNAKKVGSLDEVLASFRGMSDGDEQTSLDKLLDAVDILFSSIGDEPELLPRLLSYAVVDWEEAGIGDLPFADVLELIKVAYQVNWVEGSLKNALSKSGILKESTDLPKTQPEALAKPAGEKT